MAGAMVGTAIGAGAGFLIGVAGSMAFDFVYDNKDIIVDKVGQVVDNVVNAVKGFFGRVGDFLFG